MDELSIVTLAAAKKYTDEHGGGGGGGTSNYNQLENKPQIAGVTLQGNKSLADLGIASSTDLANKVDKENGKGLSTNDYTNTDKAIVGGVTTALSGKQNALTAGRNINLSNDEVKAGVFVEAGVDIDIDEYSIQSGTETYTIAESGLYEIFYCLTLQSAVSLSLPESANVLIERDLSISNHPVKHIVAELAAGSTVTITQTPSQWRTVMSGILKLDAISVNNVVHADSIADSSVSYKLPNDDKYYLVIGTAVGNQVASNSTRDDTSGGDPTIVKTQSAEYAKFRSVIVKGSDSPNFSFYGYDGGVASIIAFEVSLEEGNWDYNLVTKDYVDAALADKVDKVTGKGLSKNDYTDADKAKVDASLNVFTGTQAAWAALSTAEKKTYQRADFTDDYDNTAIGDLTALHTSAKSSIVNAINEVADGKQNSTDNSLQTTDKTIVGGINEVKSGLTYHKVGESAATGTYAAKLQSLASAYNNLSFAQRRSALLVMNTVDVYLPVNCSGNWFSVWIDSTGAYTSRYGIDGSAYFETGGTVTDNSTIENANVFELWICEP